MQPRDPDEAAQTFFILAVVSCVVTAFYALVSPSSNGGSVTIVSILIPVLSLVLVGAWVLRRSGPEHLLRWTFFPFGAVAAIIALDVATTDASLAAQIFLLFPVLYAASQLRRSGAASVTVAAASGVLAVDFWILSVHEALIQSVFVVTAIATSALLLVNAGERRDALVAKLKELAEVDALTGLKTRRVLDEAAAAVLAPDSGVTEVALIVIDVDRFKVINDEWGHPVGDEVLRHMGQILLNRSREDDVATRMGGDELALLLPGCTELAAFARAEEIRADVRMHSFSVVAEKQLSMSISVGVAHAATEGLALQTLYARADAGLYSAKRAGRNRVGRAS